MNERDVFAQAIEIDDDRRRREFLAQACGEDDSLHQRVESLLDIYGRAGSFLERPAIDPQQTACFEPTAEKPGTLIGRYKLLEQIGEGGMGVVFMAEQLEPVRRKVALKIVKPGMDSRQVIVRFEAERQALALMDHPNIARVLDGGSTGERNPKSEARNTKQIQSPKSEIQNADGQPVSDIPDSDLGFVSDFGFRHSDFSPGRPYFVMELVRGIPITEYCDQYHVPLRQRLELFVQVCHAVQHAHQKGIIHRDIKPSNVMVTLHDGTPVPKVIDFGVAKAIGHELTERTLFTTFAQLIGTPLYMSPEQAALGGLDIDTRSDVYSLGVLLYEMLTGRTPFESDRLREAGYDEMRRIIREEEPPRPSIRVTTLKAACTTDCPHCHGQPRELVRKLRGELDWIVMKCLDKDRTRRYESASALAADVERYLKDEPVEACPPSAAYRLKKLFRRHKGPVLAASVVLVALMVTVGLAVTLALRERQGAQRRLLVQHEINDVLTEVARLRGQVSATALGDQTTLMRARERMQRALALTDAGPADAHLIAQVRQLASELDQEERDRKLLAALDAAWFAKPSFSWDRRFANEESVPFLRDALTADGLVVGHGDPQTVATQIRTRQAKVQSEIVAALYEWHSLLSPPIGVSLNDSGRVAYVSPESPAGRDGRVKTGDRIVGIGQGSGASVTSTSGMTLPKIVQLLRGEPGTVVRLEVLPIASKEPRTLEIHRDTTAAWLWAVIQAADPDPWRRSVREACELEDDTRRRAELEKLARAPDLAGQPVRFLARLGAELASANAIDHATTFLKKVWQQYPNDVATNISLAICLRRHQPPQHEESLRYYTAIVALRPESPSLRMMRGSIFGGLGKYEEAMADNREVLRRDPNNHLARANVGVYFYRQGKVKEAIAEYREAIRLKPDFPGHHSNLGVALSRWGNDEEAIAEYREAIRLKPDFSEAHNNLGGSLRDQRKLEEAIAAFREAIRLKPDYVMARNNLGASLRDQGKLEEAIAEFREAIRVKPDDPEAHYNLGHILREQEGKLEEAIAEFREAVRLSPNDDKHKVSRAYALGAAEYRAGHWAAAIEALEETKKLGSDTAVMYSGFRLSIAHWRLGHQEQARQYYDKSVKWMEKNCPEDADLKRYRAEAAELLGIPVKPPAAKEVKKAR